MGLKEQINALHVLGRLPYDEAVAVVDLWRLFHADKRATADMPVELSPTIAAKTCEPRKRKVCTRQRFIAEELKFIRDCLASGLSQAGTAREAKIKFNRRTIGAYELRVSEIAKERKNAN